MLPTSFGTAPELLLQLYAMRSAEDIARAERSRPLGTRQAKQPRPHRWVSAFHLGPRRSQHLPPSGSASSRLA